MLEEFIRITCSTIMFLTEYYIISKISKLKPYKIDKKIVLLIIPLIYLSAMNYKVEYRFFYSISIFMLNISVCKIVFKINIERAIVAVSIFTIMLFISDTICASIFRIFFNIEEIRSNLLIFLITNILVSIICIGFIYNKKLLKSTRNFYKEILNKKELVNITFLILLVVDFCLLAYNLTRIDINNLNYVVNSLGMIIFGIITYIFIENRNSYNQLSYDYDNLFIYIQNFEDWIEKEQLNRHEYKNQLAVLRCLTKEKKVKQKIDEILEDNISIENQAVTQLKSLPKGGIKGLLYYKAALAQKNKINLVTNVSLERKSILSKLSEKEIKVLCKLIGIYFDNAIEAAIESKKKIISIEIYELKDKVNFVFSNTFKKHQNFEDRNKKGISTKGKGRGNGLYFASKLVEENNWIDQKQEIIDKYYIQTITIKNK